MHPQSDHVSSVTHPWLKPLSFLSWMLQAPANWCPCSTWQPEVIPLKPSHAAPAYNPPVNSHLPPSQSEIPVMASKTHMNCPLPPLSPSSLPSNSMDHLQCVERSKHTPHLWALCTCPSFYGPLSSGNRETYPLPPLSLLLK